MYGQYISRPRGHGCYALYGQSGGVKMRFETDGLKKTTENLCWEVCFEEL